MKYFSNGLQIIFLYTIYLLGAFLQSLLNIPVPGSILGMILLFTALHFRLIRREWLSLGGGFLLKHLPLLFIPATVGIINYLDIFKGKGFLTIAIVFLSTFIVMVVSSQMSDLLINNRKEAGKYKGFQ